MSKATFYEHFANKEECILALFDEAATEVMRQMATGLRRRGRHLPRARGRRHRRVPAHARRVPNAAQTLLVEIIGAGPARDRAPRRDPRGLRRRALPRQRARRPARRRAALRLARRRVRGRRRRRRARLAPPAHGPPRRRPRARAGASSGCMLGAAAARARAIRDSRRSSARSRTAAAARGSSRGASRWRARSARRSPTRSTGARPVPGFGDPAARVLVLGLAPAAHGANRTGRVFTGDRSGDLLFAALHRAGLRQPADVGVTPTTASSCATPGSPPRCAARRRPTSRRPTERDTCLPWTVARARAAPARARRRLPRRVRLGRRAAPARRRRPRRCPGPRPRFGHGARWSRPSGLTLLGCFHPRQQNTFTGRLTEAMIDEVLAHARAMAAGLRPNVPVDRASRRTTAGADRQQHSMPVRAGDRDRRRSGPGSTCAARGDGQRWPSAAEPFEGQRRTARRCRGRGPARAATGADRRRCSPSCCSTALIRHRLGSAAREPKEDGTSRRYGGACDGSTRSRAASVLDDGSAEAHDGARARHVRPRTARRRRAAGGQGRADPALEGARRGARSRARRSARADVSAAPGSSPRRVGATRSASAPTPRKAGPNHKAISDRASSVAQRIGSRFRESGHGRVAA